MAESIGQIYARVIQYPKYFQLVLDSFDFNALLEPLGLTVEDLNKESGVKLEGVSGWELVVGDGSIWSTHQGHSFDFAALADFEDVSLDIARVEVLTSPIVKVKRGKTQTARTSANRI